MAAIKRSFSPDPGNTPTGIPAFPPMELLQALLQEGDPSGISNLMAPIGGMALGPGEGTATGFPNPLHNRDVSNALKAVEDPSARAFQKAQAGGYVGDKLPPAPLGEFDLGDLVKGDREYEQARGAPGRVRPRGQKGVPPPVPPKSAPSVPQALPQGPNSPRASQGSLPPLDPQSLLAPGGDWVNAEPFISPDDLMDAGAMGGNSGMYQSPGSPLPKGMGGEGFPGMSPPGGIQKGTPRLVAPELPPAARSYWEGQGNLAPRSDSMDLAMGDPLHDLGSADTQMGPLGPGAGTQVGPPPSSTQPQGPGPLAGTTPGRPGAFTNPGRPGNIMPPTSGATQSPAQALSPTSTGPGVAAGLTGLAGLGLAGGVQSAQGARAGAEPSSSPASTSALPSPTGPGTGPDIPHSLQDLLGDVEKLKAMQTKRGLWGPAGTPQGVDLQKLMDAFRAQESGGNAGARNARTDASGLYQVMPGNIGPWSKEAGLGDVTQEQFLGSPEIQSKVAKFKLQQYLDQAKGKTQDPDEQVRRVASAWYSGHPGLYENIAGVGPEGKESSIRDYSLGILSKYKGSPQSGRIGSILSHVMNPFKRAQSLKPSKSGIPTRDITKDLPSSPYDAPMPSQVQDALDAAEEERMNKPNPWERNLSGK